MEFNIIELICIVCWDSLHSWRTSLVLGNAVFGVSPVVLIPVFDSEVYRAAFEPPFAL